jgi:phosphoglycolate phosphatase
LIVLREVTIIGAKKVGVRSMGVLFGYGGKVELENAGADFLVETVSDIKNVLLAS